MLFRILPLLCTGAVVLLCAPPVQEQSKLVCAVDAGLPPVLRTEGTREFAGQLRFRCQGGTPGQTITTDLLIGVNTGVTGRQSGEFSEALLGIGEAPYTAGVSAFQGVVAGPASVRFSIAFTAPAAGAERVLHVMNLRVNASAAPIINFVPEIKVSIAFSNPLVVPSAPTAVIGFLTQGVKAEIFVPGPAGSLAVSACAPQNPAFPAAATPTFYLRFAEQFHRAFKHAFYAAFPGSDTESGFYDPAFPSANAMNLAGRATQGTRLVARFRNVPAGVTLYATVKPAASSTGATVAELLGANGSLATAAAQVMVDGVVSGVAAIAISQGTGEAVWEVTTQSPATLDDLRFAVFASYTGSVAPALMSVDMGFGPVAEATAFPSFAGLSERKFSFQSCSSSLPDLRVVANTTGFSGSAGNTVTMSVVVENAGGGDAAPFKVRFGRVAPFVLSPTLPFAIAQAPALSAGSSITLSGTFVLENYLAASSVGQVAATADYDQHVPESNEGNNQQTYPLQITNCVFIPTAAGAILEGGGPFTGRVGLPQLYVTGCTLQSASGSPWLSLEGALQNATGVPRTGYLNVNGYRFRITQFGEGASLLDCFCAKRNLGSGRWLNRYGGTRHGWPVPMDYRLYG